MKIANTEYYKNLTAFLRVAPLSAHTRFNDSGFVFTSDAIVFSLKRLSKNNYSIICNFNDLTFQYYYGSIREAVHDVHQLLESNGLIKTA